MLSFGCALGVGAGPAVLRPGLPHVWRQVRGPSSESEQRWREWSGPGLDLGTVRSESMQALWESGSGSGPGVLRLPGMGAGG